MSEVSFPRNHLTQLIDRVKEENQMYGGRGPVESTVSAGPTSTVRSSSLGPVVPSAPPMSEAENAEANAKLRALGILPPDPLADAAYGSLEEAIAAGAPVDAINLEVQPHMTGSPSTLKTDHLFKRPGRTIMVSAEPSMPSAPHLPDFSKVQGIDLIRNVVYIDGMEFLISEEDSRDLRVYVVQTASNAITAQFTNVLNALVPGMAEAVDGEGTTEVSQMRESERVSRGSEGREPAVPGVPKGEQMDLFSNSSGTTEQTRPTPRRVKSLGVKTRKQKN